MNLIRGSALCSICSGRHQNFENNGKLLIDSKSCNQVIFKCKDFFAELARFAQSLDDFIEESNDHPSLNKYKSLIAYLNFAKQELENYLPEEVLSSLAKIKLSTQTNTGNNADLCGMIMNLRKEPVVDYLNRTLVPTVNKVSKALRRIASEESSGETSRRLDRMLEFGSHKLSGLLGLKPSASRQLNSLAADHDFDFISDVETFLVSSNSPNSDIDHSILAFSDDDNKLVVNLTVLFP